MSYLSGLGIHLIVLALTTLLPMSRSVSPVDVSLPSQIAWKKRCSIFGSCLKVGSRYCTVSPNSQIGSNWSSAVFVPSAEIACVAVRVCCVPVEQVRCVSYQPWYYWVFAGDSSVVVLL